MELFLRILKYGKTKINYFNWIFNVLFKNSYIIYFLNNVTK